MAGKYRLVTLGCKVNQYESQQIREVLESCGLAAARRGEEADLAVVNTCAVTAQAVRKNRQAIRRLARNGRTPVIVVGCGASAETDRLRKLHGVAAVFGHDVDVPAELRRLVPGGQGPVGSAAPPKATPISMGNPSGRKWNEVSMKPAGATLNGSPTRPRTPTSPSPILPRPLPIVKTEATEIGRIHSFAGHQRAFLKIQDGCDAYCTYCIIPRLRPTLRSKPVEEAVDEARSLVRAGHRELILTGIFLGAYGRPSAIRKRLAGGRSALPELVGALARVEGLERLRLSSLEPGDVDEALLEVLATEPACVAHLHLPLQSGSTSILRRMNRQYTSDQFLRMIDRVRNALDRPAISTDILVGFPGESEEDFARTIDVARYAEFCKVHAFPFSPRAGTAAQRWVDRYVPGTVVEERLARLRELERQSSMRFRRRLIGETERIIVEKVIDDGGGPAAGTRLCCGRTDRYFEVHAGTDGPTRTGDIARVRIDRVTPTRTHGTLIPTNRATYPLAVLPTSAVEVA